MNIPALNHKHIFSRHFEVLVDPKPGAGREPVMAIMIDPKDDEKAILPMDLRTARDLGVMLIDTLVKVAPEMVTELFQ